MRILIKEEDSTIELSNEQLDIPSFVDVIFSASQEKKVEITVLVSELYSAVLAFHTLYEEEQKREKLLR